MYGNIDGYLAVNYVSFDSSVSEMINYLKEHMEFNPDQRELYKSALLLDESEERELKVLSSPADK